LKREQPISPAASALLEKLRIVAARGPLVAVSSGAPAVGMTLLRALDVPYSSTSKPNYRGVAITARRGLDEEGPTRVNLFARVPDWKQSPCKSSGEIAAKFGYPFGDEQRLHCTVRANRPNPQGLMLRVDSIEGLLKEVAQRQSGSAELVAVWSLKALQERLSRSHPESMWVRAVSTRRDGVEYLQYRKAVYTGSPFIDRLPRLIDEGTVTMDHLIKVGPNGTVEKGPLFKIAPQNISLLFPTSLVFDLLSL
jgi:hypothetical protein